MSKKRRKRSHYGEGWSRELTSGKWQASVPDGAGKYRSLGTYDTEEEADKARWRHLLAGKDPLSLPLSDWLDLWWPDHEARNRAATLKTDKYAIDNHVRPHLGTVPIGQLDAARITAWLSTLTATQDGKLKAWQALRKALRANPAVPYAQIERVRSPKVRRAKKRSLTWEEYRRLIETADTWQPRWHPYAGAMFRIAVECCCRPGELLGLRKQDYADGVISIEQAWNRAAGEVGPLKNEWSRRKIGLTKEGRAAVEAWLAKHPGGAPMWPSRRGNYPDYKNFHARVWKRLRAAAKMPDGFGLHELRHTGISLLMASGANILAVAKRAGHRDGVLILRVYGHLLPDSQEKLTTVFESGGD